MEVYLILTDAPQVNSQAHFHVKSTLNAFEQRLSLAGLAPPVGEAAGRQSLSSAADTAWQNTSCTRQCADLGLHCTQHRLLFMDSSGNIHDDVCGIQTTQQEVHLS